MKKFFSVIPMQVTNQLKSYVYRAVDNEKLGMEEAIRFPILAAISGYAQPGEEIRVIALSSDNDACRANCREFCREVEAMCSRRGILLPRGVELLFVAEEESVASQVQSFEKLLPFMEDDDELFACMTYGTKPMSQVLMMAIQYAYRIKKNTIISCIVYGKIERPSKDRSSWEAYVYDMTALVQMDEIVRVLADRGVENPGAIISHILAL